MERGLHKGSKSISRTLSYQTRKHGKRKNGKQRWPKFKTPYNSASRAEASTITDGKKTGLFGLLLSHLAHALIDF